MSEDTAAVHIAKFYKTTRRTVDSNMPPIQLTLNITCIGIGTVGAVGAAAPTKHFKGGIAPTRFSQTYTRKQVIEVQKLVGLLPMYCIWVSFIGSEEPSIKLLRSAELQRTNSSPIPYCQHSKSAIFFRAI